MSLLAIVMSQKTYKLYNPSTKKLIVSRDVQFIEDEAWDGSLEKTVNVKTIVSHEEEEEGTVGNNTERGGESVLSSNLINLPYLIFELFLHVSTIK